MLAMMRNGTRYSASSFRSAGGEESGDAQLALVGLVWYVVVCRCGVSHSSFQAIVLVLLMSRMSEWRLLGVVGSDAEKEMPVQLVTTRWTIASRCVYPSGLAPSP